MPNKKQWKIIFENVGRDKTGWVWVTDNFAYSAMDKEIRRKRVLHTRYPDFSYDEATKTGNIYAGDRLVGSYRVEEIDGA